MHVRQIVANVTEEDLTRNMHAHDVTVFTNLHFCCLHGERLHCFQSPKTALSST